MAIATDVQLIKAAREGDKEAFGELVRRYESQVAATVIGMLGKCPEADDVGQEAFIRFYKALSAFRGDSGVGTYLTRIAINLSLNELKRRKRKEQLFQHSDSEFVSTIPDRRSEGIGFEDKEVIDKALQELIPEHRSVLVLRLIDGYSTEETAAILKIPVGTVLSRLARAQRKMKEILTPHYREVQ